MVADPTTCFPSLRRAVEAFTSPCRSIIHRTRRDCKRFRIPALSNFSRRYAAAIPVSDNRAAKHTAFGYNTPDSKRSVSIAIVFAGVLQLFCTHIRMSDEIPTAANFK